MSASVHETDVHASSSRTLIRLAGHAVACQHSVLPDAVRHAAVRCVTDWFAATVPGSCVPPATLLAAALGDEVGSGRACLVPSGVSATMRAAALINGSAAHTIEFDDIYRDALYHPGAPVIAAALAATQGDGATGDRFVRAVVAGYEISTRIGVVVNPAHYDFWHSTGTIGAFGAAAAAGTVFGLDELQMAHALATAATLAAGLQQAFRSDAMSKPIHAGRAAETGVLVARAAAQGVTGALDVLEGPRGFGCAMSRDVDWGLAVADLKTFNITRTTFKNHAACGHTHPALDAALVLHETVGMPPAEIALIEVATYAKALEVTGNADPRTRFEAQFSLPYCVAVALSTGRVRLEAFSSERLRDPAVRALMQNVHLRVDPAAEAAYPRQRSALVRVTLRNGHLVEHLALTRKGDPDNPLSDEELADKFDELVTPVLGREQAGVLLARLRAINELDDPGSLLRGLTGMVS